MKIVHLKNRQSFQKRHAEKQKKKGPSQEQLRQRELAWAMYVTGGYVGNLKHLLAVNAYTMSKTDIATVKLALQQAQGISNTLHAAMMRERERPVRMRRVG